MLCCAQTEFYLYLIFSDEERDEEAEATADGEREGEERSGSEKADSDHEEEAEKSEASPKEGSDGGLFYSVISCREYKHFVKLELNSSLGSICNMLLAGMGKREDKNMLVTFVLLIRHQYLAVHKILKVFMT